MESVKEKYKSYLNSATGARIYNRFKEILYGKPDALVLNLCKIIAKEIGYKKNIRILDVGGGDGKRLFLIMKMLKAKGVLSSAVLVEPSKAFAVNARREIKSRKIPVLIINKIFESAEPKGGFDLILFVHSIYTFKNKNYLRKAKKLLAPNGSIIIQLNQEGSLLSDLKAAADRFYNSSRKEVSSVFQDLKSLKYAYTKRAYVPRFRSFLRKGKLTADGRLVLGWMALMPEKAVPAKLYSEAETIYKKHTRARWSSEPDWILTIK